MSGDLTTGDPTKIERRRRRRWRYRGTVALFMSPWILGFSMFIVYPTIATVYFSFTHYDLLNPPEWVGLSNYRYMASDPNFWLSIRNTLWLVIFGVSTQVLFALVTALVLMRPKRGKAIYRTIYFVPTMVPAVAAAFSFVFLLNPQGPINAILGFFHLPQPLWFQDPQWSKPGLLVLGLWGVGETMIIFLAGMLDVPNQLYEAAALEGASPWQRFRHITLPMISPVIFFAVVMGVISSFQYFTQAFVAAGAGSTNPSESLGGAQGSLMFYPIWLYEQGFQYLHLGYAAAMGWILFLIIMACTIVLIRTSDRWVYYQGGLR